jgi:hypothetical protein
MELGHSVDRTGDVTILRLILGREAVRMRCSLPKLSQDHIQWCAKECCNDLLYLPGEFNFDLDFIMNSNKIKADLYYCLTYICLCVNIPASLRSGSHVG